MSIEQQISDLLKQKNALLLAHYYVDGALQDLAEKTGGIVSDSLEMARFGRNSKAETLVIAGVRFMGETAKILSPEKNILVVDKEANCSLDISCPIDEFNNLCNGHLDRTVVVYANTSAEVKARADWVVTSGSALKVIANLHKQGKKILWAPDKHLGHYIKTQTDADILLWDGACIVHEEFKADGIKRLKNQYNDVAVLVHPESPKEVIKIADVVGSTTALVNAVKIRPEKTFIVATDSGIFHKMHQVAPHKKILEAPTHGSGATCESCAHCHWMALNTLEKCLTVLQNNQPSININPTIITQAQKSINRLLEFTQ